MIREYFSTLFFDRKNARPDVLSKKRVEKYPPIIGKLGKMHALIFRLLEDSERCMP
jgi:hypothetical protein